MKVEDVREMIEGGGFVFYVVNPPGFGRMIFENFDDANEWLCKTSSVEDGMVRLVVKDADLEQR